MISATVICRNEEANISGCLDSLAWCDEVVLVDAMSSDRTVEIAKRRGARVFEQPWPGFSAQRNFALDQCQGDFCLYLDADERLSPGFGAEARAIEALGDSALKGYWVNSLEYFMGDFLRHGGYGLHQANRKLRFWRNHPEHRFRGDVHEHVDVPEPLGHFSSHVEHYSSAATLSGLLTKLNRYTDLETTRETARPAELVLGPARVFLSRYVKHQGFRDGMRGFVMAQVNAFYRFAAVAKQLERQIDERSPRRGGDQ